MTFVVKPFLKWAGGKTSLVSTIKPFLPENCEQKCLIEPFLGSGAMFFFLRPKRAILSDINIDLINCFISVRDNHKTMYSYLRKHSINNSSKYYYFIREMYNTSHSSASQSARLIYLNKACFNGVFRVNKDGEFNVPYSNKQTINLPSIT